MSFHVRFVFSQVVRIALVALALATSVHAGARADTPDDAHTAPSRDGVVNINTASAEQLRLLPRIGEEKAARILAHRAKTPFKTVHELARVRGVGLRTLRALKPWLTVAGPTTLTQKARLSRPSKGEATSAPAAPRPRTELVPVKRSRG
jgi:competence protein ComEA